jgi:hypothetical protein
MNETKNKIIIGSKQTQLFQRCPDCQTLVKIPRRQMTFIGTPFYFWEMARHTQCPKCHHTVFINTPDEQRRLRTRDDILYAFDIEIEKETLDINGEPINFLRDSYVVIFKDRIQFVDRIDTHNFHESVYVCTAVDFDGNVAIEMDW